MNPIVRALLAAYNFLAGDMFILVGGVIAFAGAAVLAHGNHVKHPAFQVSNVAVAAFFVAVIVLSLLATLARERFSSRR